MDYRSKHACNTPRRCRYINVSPHHKRRPGFPAVCHPGSPHTPRHPSHTGYQDPPPDHRGPFGRTDRPASGRIGPPRDRQARLGMDRPASGQTGPPRDGHARHEGPYQRPETGPCRACPFRGGPVLD
ncbi:hypothetical protein T484DRAFT_2252685 [Baffinella frigidus]|nr:hypothetical protein T484DRAFT_2252685 [Cryptophyta sp. CCMP2293]